MTSAFLFYKARDDPRVRVVATHTTGMILTDEGTALHDIRDHSDEIAEQLSKMTLSEIKEFMNDYGVGVSGRPTKARLIQVLIANWTTVMEKVDAVIPDYEARINQTLVARNKGKGKGKGENEAVSPFFGGQGYKLGEGTADAEETKEKAPVMRLVVRPQDGSKEGAMVVPVYDGDTPTTIIEALVPLVFGRVGEHSDPDTTRVAMMMKFVKVRDNTVLHATTPIQDYFDQAWGEVRLLKRDGVHDLISAQFCASGHLWMKTTGQDDSHAKMEDGVVLKAKSESTKGCLTVKVGDNIRLYFNYEPSDRIKDVLESMEAKFGLKVAQADGAFKLKYLATGSFFEDWEPVHATVAEDEDGGRAELVVSLRGGGKTVKKTNLKKSLVAEMKENLQEQARTADVSMVDTVGETVATAKHDLTTLFASADADPRAVLNKLIGNASTEVLGNSKDTSPLLEMLGKGRREYRLNEVGNAVMKANFARLYDLYAEVGGLTETCELTWDVIVNQAFMKDDGSFDWAGFRRLIEDAIVIKASRQN